MPRFGDFERADGWTAGQPEVFYKPEVVEALGVPLVIYDSLEEFFVADLRVPKDFKAEILLYGTRGAIRDELFPGALGSYHPFRLHRMWVNGVMAEKETDYTLRTMGVVAHEGQHMADRANGPFRVLGGMLLGTGYKYERRARAQQAHESLLRHQNDISFPTAMANR
jgi:hypothetical protein